MVFQLKLISADNHNLNEVIELIQKDLRTLERAVYIENFSTNLDSNSQDVNEYGSELRRSS